MEGAMGFMYKLAHGLHFQNDAEGKERMYRPGEVFESPIDLTFANGVGMTPKFEPVIDNVRSAAPQPDFLTYAPREKLEAIALALDIDVPPGCSDESLRRAIRSGQDIPSGSPGDPGEELGQDD